MKRLFIVLIVIGAVWWVWHLTGPTDPSSTAEVIVTIDRGSSVSSIAENLADHDLIRSPLLFKMYTRVTGVSSELQAGMFSLSKSLSLSEVVRVLHAGGAKQLSITIPEGFTVADIDALLAARGLGKPGDIIDCAFRCNFDSFEFLPTKAGGSAALGYGSRLEGYLFPETYALSTSGYVPKYFLERMLGEFRKRIVVGHEDAIRTSGHTLPEIVTMASLIERESRHDEEREIVSGILWKRLTNRVVLGVDATTRYEVGKKTEPLTKSELETASPYNTRRRQGLPPGPIANPSESSILAAISPKDSSYWYYLHDSNGIIRYAVTAEEHTKNKRMYIR